jgi:phosphohistidine swiveling domain-containing protein
LLERVHGELGIDTAALDAYKIAELRALFEGVRVHPRTIAARQRAYAVYFESGAIRMVTGRTALAYAERVAQIEAARARSAIVGQVANRGKDVRVQGVVRLINVDYGDIERMDTEIAEMRKGEILVSEFTAPELMEACRKARAIITDLGGMLSHAAIVSRELGIPCIVGTQHGSKALTTGDRVTVDLDSGLVEKRQ